ncbi:hypothetical protein SAMN05216327_105284 [Dyadobacter sp. SG02]|uniref:DUF6916 family protein n=1 Tax=Dyadobacter sp. SG02 TaxID=1855291 RepID=UPI0008C25E59|nr:hypothetical protein [Dyadobacter sp. SG02]SEJ01497.1 hypothetical protein SAMN05216327_105284 [Dyadobacter sp. SG02]
MEAYDLSKITIDDFSKYLNQTLDVRFTDAQTTPAVLTRVTALNSYTPIERGPFSVELQTTGDHTHRPQGIYQILHPDIKELDLFLVPIGPDASGMRYEAVFS